MHDDDMADSGFDDDEGATPDELAQIKLATPEQLAAVDALVLRHCGDEWRKVARVVGEALDEFEARFPALPYVAMQLRMQELVKRGLLEAQGDVMAMRRAAVRLP